MKEKLLSLVLSFCLVLGLVGAMMPAVLAGETPTEGNLSDTITWRFDPETGVLTLSGTGEISFQFPDDTPWEEWKPQILALVLNDGIEYVGSNAFTGLEALERVALPESVNFIGSYAFADCGKLKDIDLSGITYIDIAAFENCASLTSVQFSPQLSGIAGTAFRGCKSLTAVEIPASVQSLGGYLFTNCTNLKTVRFLGTLSVLDDGTFENCVNLTEIQLPDGLVRIDLGAFRGCESLEAIDLPQTLRWIEGTAFSGCKSLKKVVLPDTVEEIGVGSFANCSAMREIKLSSKLTQIPTDAFNGCAALEKVEIPDGVTSIAKNAFSYSGIREIYIPDGVTTIGEFAFFMCNRLESISIPASVQEIGRRALVQCESLASIEVATGNPNYSSKGSGALMNKAGTELLCVPGGIGVEFAVPEGVEIIAKDAFRGCHELVAVDLPDSLRVIRDVAFGDCDRLRKITIPAGVTELGFDLFSLFKEGVTDEELKLVVEFTGDMPDFDGETFMDAILTAYYPEDNATWAEKDNLPAINAADITWIPYVPHTYGDWEILEKPTATEYGLKKRVCTDCGKEDTRPINKLDAEETITNPFTDIRESDYFYTPVLWAASEGITTGTTATTFTPHASCTRAQIVTFLWRAMGQPEPEGSKNPFVDVKKSEYYYDAVLWAVEQGITTGVTSTTFAPNATCTRGQVVTFLWRAAGCPEPEKSGHSFTDLKTAEYYYDAVLWAVEQEITNGMTPTTFQPNGFCTRGQVVTFLWRYLV